MHIRIEVIARFVTPFSVGTGALGGTAADKPLLKDPQGLPYLPGSALKGLLRHEAEKLVRALRGDDAVCRPPNPAKMCPQGRPPKDPYCPVCRVFGSPWRPSSLTFSDLKPDEKQGRQVIQVVKDTGLRFGVGIGRYRGAAAEDLLYTIEVASATTAVPFIGTIEGDIPDDEGRWPLAVVLASLRTIGAVGGARSRGLGWVNLEAAGVEPIVPDVKEVLEEWLTSPSALQSP